MHDTPDISLIVGVYAVLIGTGWGILVDPLRPASYWIAAVSVALTGFLVAGLAPEAVVSAPLLVVAFTASAFARDRWWRRSLIARESPLRTPPPPPPSTSGSG